MTTTKREPTRLSEQLDVLALHWSRTGTAHREGCKYLHGETRTGSIADAALSLVWPCGHCFTGHTRTVLERRIHNALLVAIGRRPGPLRLPVGMTWPEIHTEASRVRSLTFESVDIRNRAAVNDKESPG